MDAESHNLAVQKKPCRDATWYWRLDTIQVKAATRDTKSCIVDGYRNIQKLVCAIQKFSSHL